MPVLGDLLKASAHGTLESTIPPVTAPAWSSFQTGTNPGKHGVFDFSEYRPGSYGTSFANRTSIRRKTIWQLASESGNVVVTVNVPMTYPPQAINGAVVSGMLAPSTRGRFTYPESLATEITAAVGDYRILDRPLLRSENDVRDYVRRMILVEENRLRTAFFLMDRYNPNLIMLHNQSLDALQHRLWPLARANNGAARSVGDFYRFVDESIGKILAAVEGEYVFIIMSDHGFGSLDRLINLNRWLRDNGYLSLNRSAGKRLVTLAMSLVRRLDKLDLRHKVFTRKAIASMRTDFSQDWARTKAFSVNGNVYGHVYLNCSGREPEGIVSAGSMYEQAREEIADGLLRVVDPESQTLAIRKVYKREQVFSGPFVDWAPDLILEPNDGYGFIVDSADGPLFRDCSLYDSPVGGHRRDGIFIMHAPQISIPGLTRTARIVDVAPTVLHLLGVPVPRSMDGEVLVDTLDQEFQKRERVLYHDDNVEPGDDGQGMSYSEADSELIRERLEGIGYT